MVGANPWYILAEDYWYIVARGVTPGVLGLQFETDAHLMAGVEDRFYAPVACQL